MTSPRGYVFDGWFALLPGLVTNLAQLALKSPDSVGPPIVKSKVPPKGLNILIPLGLFDLSLWIIKGISLYEEICRLDVKLLNLLL